MLTQTESIQSSARASQRVASGVFAMLAGSALIFLVGFAPMTVLHNAAHDTRHSSAFPCH